MKRSAKYYSKARRSALWSVLWFTTFVGCGVWSVNAVNNHAEWAVVPLAIAALAAFFGMFNMASDCARLMNLAQREEAEEWRRAIRPRL